MGQLKLMIKELCHMNNVFDFDFKKLKDLNKKYDVDKLESQAKVIRQNLEIQFDFLEGDSSGVEDITNFYSVQYLNDYMNEVFELL